MLFNSYEFIFAFLPITFFIYFYLNTKKLTVASKGFLVFASLFFYSWWNVIYLPLILTSMLFNYLIGTSLTQENLQKKRVNKKTLLTFGVISNLLLLGYFKYADFFISNINLVTGMEGNLLHLTLPLGISFFTFTQIAYLVDSYRGETKEYDLLNYGLFVTFFPHLLAGPILHHKEMMPQFAKTSNLVKNYKNITLGLLLFSMGLFKKVVIADTFAVWVNNGFENATTLNLIEAWATSLSYTFQLYFDFSGYTDMAIGVALLFNIVLPFNFNSPYKATNIQEFWRRWHITLSRFLRDYIYIPLGGNRRGNVRTYFNLLITFILGGLWHGAGWTFVFWGFLHGFALVIHRIWNTLGFKLNTILAWFITFNFINITWVFFRAKEWHDAIGVLGAMFGNEKLMNTQALEIYTVEHRFSVKTIFMTLGANVDIIKVLLLSFLIVLVLDNSNHYLKKMNYTFYTVLFVSAILAISILNLNSMSEFLYFNF